MKILPSFWLNILLFFYHVHSLTEKNDPTKFNVREVEKWVENLGNELYKVASTATQVDELIKSYRSNNAKVEQYDPEITLDFMVDRLSRYLDKRRTLAQVLKVSLEIGDTVYEEHDWSLFEKKSCLEGTIKNRLSCIERLTQHDFRFVDARPGDPQKEIDSPTMMSDNETMKTDFLINGIYNPNFYNLSVDTTRSAVHVPVPIYKLKPELLEEIYWSGEILDPIFRDRRENKFPAASWQFYCSTQGFMRFYPGAMWNIEGQSDRSAVDLYDCRNSEWFIDGATNAKNVIILLDMSGSMYGQRFEIAKQTIDAIFESLSENDFFNIISYNIESEFLLSYFAGELIQATLRNKKLMKDYLANPNNKSPENLANLGKALELAFKTLLRMNMSISWNEVDWDKERTPEEKSQHDERLEMFKFLQINKTESLGCNSAIMLVTDGAADYHKNIFSLYNPQKKIRFFSFLIGNDVTQISQVEQMACSNRGYYARISNLADVQEKVHKYIEVMSRPVAKRNQSRAIWTGAYLDKMFLESESGHVLSQRLVTTVAYPVIVNSTFRGVVGASAPITELQQMAAVYMLGANAYSFLVDNNGYVMFHPQLRSWHMSKPKPNYNSMDIMELEVLADNLVQNEINGTIVMTPKQADYQASLRIHLVDGSISRNLPKQELKVLIAMEGSDGMGPRRVYKQENVYFFRSLNDTLLTLGLAVPKTSTHRVKPDFETNFNYKGIDNTWFDGTNWRLHPDWHYCQPNDSDYMMTKEEVFVHYLKMMKDANAIPDKCASYAFLINRLLFDAKVTSPMDSYWISKARLDAKKGVHSVFLVTQTGLTRYVDMILDDITYDPPTTPVADINGTITQQNIHSEDMPYTSFFKRHTKGLDENFYRRAMRFPDGEFIFDVNPLDIVFIKEDSENFGHWPENKSIVISATRSVFLGRGESKAPIGVVGMEMLYDSFAEMVYNATNKRCNSDSNDIRCYLLDEHGYIIYTSATNDSSLMKNYLGRFFGHSPVVEDKKHFSEFVGDRAEAIVFTKLVEKEFFENFTYIDFQAICSKKDLHETVASAHRLLSPFYHLVKIFKWFVREIAILLTEYHVWSCVGNLVKPAKASAAHMYDDVACDKWKPFYLIRNSKNAAEIVMNHGFLCGEDNENQNKSCEITSIAARVPKTNLIFVILEVGNPYCSLQKCVASQQSTYWPHFDVHPVVGASDKIFVQSKSEKMHVDPRYRRSPNICYPAEDDADEVCSGAEKTKLALWSCFLTLLLSLCFSSLIR